MEHLPTTATRDDPLIVVRDLGFGYDSVPVLEQINLAVYPGEFVALIGQNGAGKTTLAKHFNGILKPGSGCVLVKGLDTRQQSVAELAVHVGYCYQNPDHQIFSATVREELEFGLRNVDRAGSDHSVRLQDIMQTVGLDCSLDEYPFSLSKGERQKLAVASILAIEPELLVVDEPTTGLDWRGGVGMMELMRRLNEQGHTLVMITHDMRLVADYASRVVVLCKGRILLDGPPRDVFAQPDVLERTFLRPPQITRLAQAMAPLGMDPRSLTIEETASAWAELVNRRQGRG